MTTGSPRPHPTPSVTELLRLTPSLQPLYTECPSRVERGNCPKTEPFFTFFFFCFFFFLTGFTHKENQYSYRNTTGLTKPEEKTAQEEEKTALEAAFSGEFGHRTTGPKRFSVSWAGQMRGRRQRNQHFIHQDEFSPGKPGQPLSPSTLCQHHGQTLLPSVRATRITRVSRSP